MMHVARHLVIAQPSHQPAKASLAAKPSLFFPEKEKIIDLISDFINRAAHGGAHRLQQQGGCR
jgi:hypothetical protein